tara:strand:+ start:497 stop:832 length:336 start_codon:yes stop_codon:yes gene_type:complete
LLASAVAVFPLAAQAADLVTGLKPASPEPTADKLTPGLAVTYYFNVFNHTREIPDWAKYKDGVKGQPILILDYFLVMEMCCPVDAQTSSARIFMAYEFFRGRELHHCHAVQ